MIDTVKKYFHPEITQWTSRQEIVDQVQEAMDRGEPIKLGRWTMNEDQFVEMYADCERASAHPTTDPVSDCRYLSAADFVRLWIQDY